MASSSMWTDCFQRWQRSGGGAATGVLALLQRLSNLNREWKMVPDHKSGALSSIRMADQCIFNLPPLHVLTRSPITLH